jgi:hypothetical protein
MMPRVAPTVKRFLSQLGKKELLNLAKTKKLNVPEGWEKSKIVDTLSVYVTASEVTSAMSRGLRAKTR